MMLWYRDGMRALLVTLLLFAPPLARSADTDAEIIYHKEVLTALQDIATGQDAAINVLTQRIPEAEKSDVWTGALERTERGAKRLLAIDPPRTMVDTHQEYRRLAEAQLSLTRCERAAGLPRVTAGACADESKAAAMIQLGIPLR